MFPPITINISAGRLCLQLFNPFHPAFFGAPVFSLLEQGLNYALGRHSSFALAKQPISLQICVLAIGWYEIQCWWDIWVSWRAQRERALSPTPDPVLAATESPPVETPDESHAPVPGLDDESLFDFDIKAELEAAL